MCDRSDQGDEPPKLSVWRKCRLLFLFGLGCVLIGGVIGGFISAKVYQMKMGNAAGIGSLKILIEEAETGGVIGAFVGLLIGLALAWVRINESK
jgi:hypothetical protein